MASANCSKHGTPLNGFGNLTFCNACDAEAAAPAPGGNSEYITIYRAEGSSHPDLSFPSYSTKPVGAKTVPWRIPETAVEGGGKDYVLVEKGTIAEKVKE